MTIAGIPVLTFLTWFPVLGAIVIALVRGDEASVALTSRWLALQTSLVTFTVSLALWFHFDRTQAGFQFIADYEWMPQWGIGYRMGVDGISVLFVLLSTALIPLCVLSAWQ